MTNKLLAKKLIKYLNNTKANESIYNQGGFKSVLHLYNESLITEKVDRRIICLDTNGWKQVSIGGDVTLSAIYHLSPKKSKKWIIAVHGYSSSKESSALSTWYLNDLGFNILAFDFRNHGQSEKGLVTLGTNEVEDLMQVIKYVNATFKPKSIGLVGFSMGAFTVNAFALRKDFDWKKNKIKFGITDSPYFGVREIFNKLFLNITPLISNYLKDVVNETIQVYQQDYGVDVMKHNLSKMIVNCDKSFPILFIHSKEDTITNCEDTKKIYNLRKILDTKDKIKIFEKGSHIRSLISNTEEYLSLVKEFIKGKV